MLGQPFLWGPKLGITNSFHYYADHTMLPIRERVPILKTLLFSTIRAKLPTVVAQGAFVFVSM